MKTLLKKSRPLHLLTRTGCLYSPWQHEKKTQIHSAFIGQFSVCILSIACVSIIIIAVIERNVSRETFRSNLTSLRELTSLHLADKKMKLICLIFIFFIFYTQLKETRQQIFLQRNDGGLKFGNFRHLHRHRLNVSPQETLQLDKEIQCVSKCVQKPDCFSLNTKKTTDDKFLCQFLNTSRYKNHENLTKDDNYVHWYFGVRFSFFLKCLHSDVRYI